MVRTRTDIGTSWIGRGQCIGVRGQESGVRSQELEFRVGVGEWRIRSQGSVRRGQ